MNFDSIDLLRITTKKKTGKRARGQSSGDKTEKCKPLTAGNQTATDVRGAT